MGWRWRLTWIWIRPTGSDMTIFFFYPVNPTRRFFFLLPSEPDTTDWMGVLSLCGIILDVHHTTRPTTHTIHGNGGYRASECVIRAVCRPKAMTTRCAQAQRGTLVSFFLFPFSFHFVFFSCSYPLFWFYLLNFPRICVCRNRI